MWFNLIYVVSAKLIKCYIPTVKLIENVTTTILGKKKTLTYYWYSDGVNLSNSWTKWIHAQTGRACCLAWSGTRYWLARIWQSALILLKPKHVVVEDRICPIFFMRNWTWEDFIHISQFTNVNILVIRLFCLKIVYLTGYSDCLFYLLFNYLALLYLIGTNT